MSEELTAGQVFGESDFNFETAIGSDVVNLMEEYAKAKTEQLQKEVERLKGLDRTPLNDGMLKANCKLKVENEKLRTALHNVKTFVNSQYYGAHEGIEELLKQKKQ